VSLMKEYNYNEKVATIAFLKMIAHSDQVLKIEEIEIIDLLSKNIGIKETDIQNLGEQRLKFTLKSMTKSKILELLRMGYSILDVDGDIHIDEIKILDYIAVIHNIDLEDDWFINTIIYGSKELTPLDKIILVAISFQMVSADGKVHHNEMQLLNKVSEEVGINLEETSHLNTSLDTLIKAIKTMSRPAVIRIMERMMAIALSDNELTEDEFNVIFPLLVEFNIELKELISMVEAKKISHANQS
jgi:uncharacterized tellurite resistance protein B-like protein